MKRQIISFALAAILVLSMLTLSACGGSSSKVPDSVLERQEVDPFIKDAPDEADLHWNAEHRVDRSAHTDDVELVVTVKGRYGEVSYTKNVTYIYDRSSDLWSRYQDGKWRETMKLYDDLLGTYTISRQDEYNTITITQVNGDSFDFAYQFDYYGEIQTSNYRWTPPSEMTLSGSATATVPSVNVKRITGDIYAHVYDVSLPEGYYWIHSLNGVQTSTDLYVTGNIFEGITSFGGGYINLYWRGDQ